MENNDNIVNKTNTDTADCPQKKSKRKRKYGLIILSVILVMIAAFAAVAVYIIGFHEPSTQVNEPPPFATDGFSETKAPENDAASETEAETDAVPETEPVETEIPRSEQKIYNFLFVGQDRVALNTDVIMIISFNTTKNHINVLQIPRDTYIEISTYSGKINGLYAHYYLNSGYDTKTGVRKFADILEQNLCIKIHNIAHINLDGVCAIVDAIGGVDVNLPVTMSYYDETQQKVVTLPAGVNHLDGKNAEFFIRHRASYLQADIGRIDAQKVFMSGFIKKIKSSFNVSTISKLVDQVFKNVTTDVTISDAVFFAKQLLDVDMSEINFMSMVGRGSMSNPDGTGLSFWIMIRKNMCEMINTYFNIYDFDITDAIFDPNRVFTSTYRYPHINNVYTLQNVETSDPYNAGSLNDNSISIPHT